MKKKNKEIKRRIYERTIAGVQEIYEYVHWKKRN